MNRCAYGQESAMIGFEERERRAMTMEPVICPKPRRVGFVNDQIRPLRMPVNHQTEMGDSKAGAELLDLILTKGGYGCSIGERHGYQVASSPPFFCGSPPSRASNPVIQDAQFGKDKISSLAPAPPSPSSLSARTGGGFVRTKFGHIPAAVRVEGFDCLSRDRRNCSISAVA